MGVNVSLSDFIYNFIDVNAYILVYEDATDNLLFEGIASDLSNSDNELLLSCNVESIRADYDEPDVLILAVH